MVARQLLPTRLVAECLCASLAQLRRLSAQDQIPLFGGVENGATTDCATWSGFASSGAARHLSCGNASFAPRVRNSRPAHPGPALVSLDVSCTPQQSEGAPRSRGIDGFSNICPERTGNTLADRLGRVVRGAFRVHAATFDDDKAQ